MNLSRVFNGTLGCAAGAVVALIGAQGMLTQPVGGGFMLAGGLGLVALSLLRRKR